MNDSNDFQALSIADKLKKAATKQDLMAILTTANDIDAATLSSIIAVHDAVDAEVLVSILDNQTQVDASVLTLIAASQLVDNSVLMHMLTSHKFQSLLTEDVLLMIVSNHRSDTQILNHILDVTCGRYNVNILERILVHPAADVAILTSILTQQNNISEYTLFTMANNLNTTSEVLHAMLNSGNNITITVLTAIINNPNVTPEILVTILNMTNRREIAQNNLLESIANHDKANNKVFMKIIELLNKTYGSNFITHILLTMANNPQVEIQILSEILNFFIENEDVENIKVMRKKISVYNKTLLFKINLIGMLNGSCSKFEGYDNIMGVIFGFLPPSDFTQTRRIQGIRKNDDASSSNNNLDVVMASEACKVVDVLQGCIARTCNNISFTPQFLDSMFAVPANRRIGEPAISFSDDNVDGELYGIHDDDEVDRGLHEMYECNEGLVEIATSSTTNYGSINQHPVTNMVAQQEQEYDVVPNNRSTQEDMVDYIFSTHQTETFDDDSSSNDDSNVKPNKQKSKKTFKR